MAALLRLVLETAQEAREVIMSIGAGPGLLCLLRWFRWRISATCELVAMASSFTISAVFSGMRKAGYAPPFAETVLLRVAFTTVCRLVAAYVGPPASRAQLIPFHRKTHPAGPGWRRVREEAGISELAAARRGDHMGKATLGWISGCAAIRSSLLAIGRALYGRTGNAVLLGALLAVSTAVPIHVARYLRDRDDVAAA